MPDNLRGSVDSIHHSSKMEVPVIVVAVNVLPEGSLDVLVGPLIL